MICMLILNVTVWKQKLNIEDIGRGLGHLLIMEQKRIPKKGLRWNPPGKRKQGWPEKNLRKTFEGNLK